MKYDFIIVSTADWDNPFWTNKQHIAKRLADRGHRVLYIDSLGLRRPTAKQSDIKRICDKLGKFTEGLKKKQHNLWVWSPVVIPFHGSPLIRQINLIFLKFYLRYLSSKLGFNKPVLWVYNPLMQSLVHNLNESVSVYHCVDELSAAPGMPIETLKGEESSLIKDVDIVFATSPNLYKTRKPLNVETYYSPNVADFHHFNKALSDQLEVPEDIEKIKGPKVGFIGAISNYKLDFNLIKSVAESNPEVNFILIGKVGEGEPGTNIDMLKNLSNVHLLGSKDYNILPSYLRFFDACMLPNMLNEYTKNMFPMKFFEYLAAGKPVVMTPLNALEEYYDLCYVSENAESFSKNVIKAISENQEGVVNSRIEEAKKHDWESRLDKMLEIIDLNPTMNNMKED